MAWEQIPWPHKESTPPPLPKGHVTAGQTDDGVTVQGARFSIRIASRTGLPDSIVMDGQELLVQPMRWNFWRALTDNDEGWKVDQKLGAWRDAGSKAVVKSFQLIDQRRRTRVVDAVVIDSESQGAHHGPAHRRSGRIPENGSEFPGTRRTVEAGSAAAGHPVRDPSFA